MADEIRFRPGGALAAWLRDRRGRMIPPQGSDALQARAELELWRAALDGELARVRLTLDQARCIADVIGGPAMRAGAGDSMGRVFAQCYAAFGLARQGPVPDESSYGAKHGIDEQALLGYLATLGPAADHALEDAMCRWWAEVQPRESAQMRDWQAIDDGHEFRADSPEGFAEVGLRVAAG